MEIPKNIRKEHIKKKTGIQYWLFAPGQNASKWTEFYNEGIMGLGWDDLGDLNNYNSKNEIVQQLQKLENTTSSKKNDATANFDFKENIAIGDIIIIKKGRSEYLGYGIVTSDYYYDDNRTDYKKCRKVNWIKKGIWKELESKTVLKTLTNITPYFDYVEKIISLIGIAKDENMNTDPIKLLITNYKKHISKTQLKNELYKWELVNQYKGRPNLTAQDFYKEIKEVKFGNLIYAMGVAVIKHLAKDKPEELRKLFINLFDESKGLTERVKSFNQDTLKIYRSLGETLQHHQDERSISTYLTFHNPKKYTFYKSSFYKKYCQLLGVKVANKNEKYTHYLSLIDDLIKDYIESDIELIEQVKRLIPDFYNGTNHKLLAQDILYQMIDKNLDLSENVSKSTVNNFEEFKTYLIKVNKKGSQRASSYLRSIELLDKILNTKVKEKLFGFKSIYNIESKNVILNLHKFILEEQKKENGIFKDEEPISYWRDRFYSAAIKSYLNFLNFKNSINNELNFDMFNISQFHQDCATANLKYSNQLVTRYISSLITKPFVLLSGLSGSGKTKLAQSFAQWICEDENQYCIVPVGADWTNREPLLGYVNALDNTEYILPENGALQLLIRANKNQEKPYFLILDEMNLSHVERYFADFLSVMESKDKFKLHTDTDNEKSGVPHELDWPKNLFVVGTVNIDETTYMFSPKVLDRANAIEFRVTEKQIESFLTHPAEIDLEHLKKKGTAMGASFVAMAKNKDFEAIDTDNLNEILVKFFVELKKTGAEFGYRTGMEIHRLYQQITVVNADLSENDKIDIAVMQKLLPKLHGSRRKLCPILETLAKLCVVSSIDVKKDFLENKEDLVFKDNDVVLYPLSLEKITRMYKGAVDNGFASYAEA